MGTLIEDMAKFNELYKDINGMTISLNGRKNFNYDRLGDLTYGELMISELFHVFSRMTLTPDMHFVDLGSGAGKITLFATLMYPFKSFQGIEIVPSLHATAVRKLNEYRSIFNNEYNISFMNQSFFDFDFTDKYCFYTNCLCFSDETCDIIADLISTCEVGSYLFSTKSVTLHSSFQDVECLENMNVSWGKNNLFIYKKVS